MYDKFEKFYDDKVNQLNDKERRFFNGVKKWTLGLYDKLKPFIIGIALFIIYYRLKAKLGLFETIFILLITQVVLLRTLVAKLS